MKREFVNAPGIVTTVALEDGNLITGTTSHVSHAIADDAKARHNEGLHGSADMKHAARVDPVVIEAYLNRNNLSLQEFLRSQDHQRRFLNDPANAMFRIWKGVV